MFTFLRLVHTPAEAWQILVPADSLENATERFGPAVVHPGTEIGGELPKCHEVGVMFLIRENEKTHVLVGGKNRLTRDEEQALSFEIEALVGAHVHDGAEIERGWFWHDCLKNE